MKCKKSFSFIFECHSKNWTHFILAKTQNGLHRLLDAGARLHCSGHGRRLPDEHVLVREGDASQKEVQRGLPCDVFRQGGTVQLHPTRTSKHS